MPGSLGRAHSLPYHPHFVTTGINYVPLLHLLFSLSSSSLLLMSQSALFFFISPLSNLGLIIAFFFLVFHRPLKQGC